MKANTSTIPAATLGARIGHAIQARWQPSIAHCLSINLFFGSALVWVAIYGIGLAIMNWPERGGFDRDLAALAQGMAVVVARNTDPAHLGPAVAAINDLKQALEQEASDPADVPGINIWHADGRWLAGSPNVPRVPLASARTLGFFDADLNGTDYRVYALCAHNCAYRIESLQAKRGRWHEFNRVMLSPVSLLPPLLAGFPLILLLSVVTVRGALKPLRELSEELAARTPGDLRPVQVSWEFAAELKPIIHAINTTFARLEAVRRRERDFLADAAHEIRTPLAVINAQIDTLSHATAPVERAAAEASLKAGMERATRLVNQLLALARLEAEADRQVTRSDLASVARDCLAAFAPEARNKSIELAYEGPDHLILPNPGYALESIVSNLVGNAVRYCGSGCQVEIHVEIQVDSRPETQTTPSAPSQIRLRILDNGPGIPAEQLPAMLERFKRGQNQHEVTGAGLGLAIVATAARQLGTTLETGPGLQGRGMGFSLTWPMIEREAPAQGGQTS